MSMRKVQEIKVTPTPDAHHDEKREHPAFGLIGAFRTTSGGGGVSLYGSDFLHSNTIRIEIREAETHRGLSRDWNHGRRTVCEIELSEAQWATFVSSLNAGEGVPCTLRARDTDFMIPALPDPVDRIAQFRKESGDAGSEAVAAMKEAIDKVERMGLPKNKTKEIVDALKRTSSLLNSTLPFIAEQFGEHMETTVERAKIEVNAYATSLLQRAGVEAIAAKSPVALPSPAKKQD